MKLNRKINKKRLMATVIICLFSVISVAAGKIVTNHLNIRSNVISEQDFLYTINQYIEQELPTVQQHEWLEIADNNSMAFLKVNSINNNIKFEEKGSSIQNSNLLAVSISTILANLLTTAKMHFKDNLANK